MNAENKGRGWTPLHSAAVSGGMRSRREIIELLQKAGAKDTPKDKHGWVPSDYMQLWEQNAAAAEKLKLYLQIPEGLSPQGGRKTPEPKKPCPPGCH